MGRMKCTDCADNQKILLEAYLKIIPCRRVTIETLSRNGNVLSTQQKENFGEPVVLNISRQEVISKAVQDFKVIENDSLITQNLFQLDKSVTTASKISVKCPFIGKEDCTKSHNVGKRKKDTTSISETFRTSAKLVEVHIDFEMTKTLNEDVTNSVTNECEGSLPIKSDKQSQSNTELFTLTSAEVVQRVTVPESCHQSLVTECVKTVIDSTQRPAAQETCTSDESFVMSSILNISDELEPSKIEPETETQATNKSYLKDTDIISNFMDAKTKSNDNNNALVVADGSQRFNVTADIIDVSEEPLHPTPSRRSSRRAPSEKYNQAMLALRPKTTKKMDSLKANTKTLEEASNKIEKKKNENITKGIKQTDKIMKQADKMKKTLHADRTRTNMTKQSNVKEPEIVTKVNASASKSENSSVSTSNVRLTETQTPKTKRLTRKSATTNNKDIEEAKECGTSNEENQTWSTDNVETSVQMTIENEIEIINNTKVTQTDDAVEEESENVVEKENENAEVTMVTRPKKRKLSAQCKEPTISDEEVMTHELPDKIHDIGEISDDAIDADYNPNDDEFVLERVTKKGRMKKLKQESAAEVMEALLSPPPFRSLQRTCKICLKTVVEGGLTKHMKLHKGSLQTYQCHLCKKVFTSEYMYNYHKGSHELQKSDGKFECPICKKQYTSKSNLFKHRRNGPCATEFKCPICGISFTSEKSLQFHNNQEHADLSVANVRCKVCKKAFVTKGGLQRHLKLKQCRTDLMCHICNKKFSKVVFFERHMLNHKEFVQKTFQCDLCGNFLGSYYSLQKHVQRHKNIRNQVCSLCSKTFLDPSGLLVHMRSHNKERPYICDKCGKSFSQSGHLLRHKLQAHDIGKFPFTCTYCGKGFVDKRNIIKHTESHEKRIKRAEMKQLRPKKVKAETPVKAEPEQIMESSVIHIEAGYDISDLLGAHVTQTNSDGSQTIISSAANLQSIEQILQAASGDPNNIEFISTQEIPADQVYGEHQTLINIEDIKMENSMTNGENIVYTIDDGVGAMESIPASDLGILAETANQFQNTEEITYYIIKKE